MSIVAALGQPVVVINRPRRMAGPGRFHIEDDAALHASAPASASAVASIGLQTLLALQEADADAVQDRAAQRHAGSMLAELSAVQRSLLQNDPAGASTAVARLSNLTRGGAVALDPRLSAIMQAIAMRAAVEVARLSPREAPG